MFLSPSEKKLLRQHAIFLDDNLPAEAYGLKPEDQVKLILEHALPDFIEQEQNGADHPVPVMFWSHGGNVLRSNAIQEAVDHIPVWIDNGVYPIYFLWDTGPFATLIDVIVEGFKGVPETQNVTRVKAALAGEHSGGVIAESADLLGVPIDWGEMKEAAAGSNTGPDGGAFQFAEELTLQKSALQSKIELHAVGHSAGSIFHAYFLPLLLNEGFKIKTLQFLAPAIRVEVFANFIRGVNASNIGEKWMFSMDKDHEKADKLLLGLYKDGSLLWFIRNVLEDPPNPDLLGLQDCSQQAQAVQGIFDHLVWTPTAAGASMGVRSQAASHTAFSKDPATLNSVAYNIRGTMPQRSF